jgi:hypothetical protein
MNHIKHTLALLAVFALAISVYAFAADETPKADAKKGSELLHVVSFKFKADATKEQKKALEDAFAALPAKIPQIHSFKWGTNVSPEKHDKGFTHCWVLGFKTEKDRDEYLVHPDHKAFGKVVGASGVADVFVVDFWAQDVKAADKSHH